MSSHMFNTLTYLRPTISSANEQNCTTASSSEHEDRQYAAFNSKIDKDRAAALRKVLLRVVKGHRRKLMTRHKNH